MDHDNRDGGCVSRPDDFSTIEWTVPARAHDPSGALRLFFDPRAIVRIGDRFFRPVRSTPEGHVMRFTDGRDGTVTLTHDVVGMLADDIREGYPEDVHAEVAQAGPVRGRTADIPVWMLTRVLAHERLCVETRRLCEIKRRRCGRAAWTEFWPDILVCWKGIVAGSGLADTAAPPSLRVLSRWMQLFGREDFDTLRLCAALRLAAFRIKRVDAELRGTGFPDDRWRRGLRISTLIG